MRSAMRDFLIGLTALLGLGGVAAMMILFGEFGIGTGDRYTLYLVLDDAAGVTEASRVTLNGVKVGALEEMNTLADPRDGVRLTLRIEPDVLIPRDVHVVLEQGLVGETTLAMRTKPTPEGQAPAEYLLPEEVLRAESITTLDEIQREITQALEGRLDALGAAAESFDELSATLTDVAQQAEDLFVPRTPEEVDRGAGAPNLASALARLDRSLVSAQEWLDDEELRADADRAIGKAADVMDQVSEAVSDWSNAARTLEQQANEVGGGAQAAFQDFAQMTRSVNTVLADVQAITAGIQRGEGTVGMLVQNPDLYRSLNDAAIRLEKALLEAQLMIEKYRKEGVPIQF